MTKKRPAPPKRRPAARSAGIWYVNAAGRTVQDTAGRIDPEKLYYVQPDGSYEQGGDRRTIGRVKPPPRRKRKVKK